jgi:carbamoyl-phosphate synthase small subunit
VSQRPHAILALADGTIFHGVSIGVAGIRAGEVAFNTAMTGYQEILTDPSYCQQIITLTYPHIGNTGINLEDFESGNIDKVYAAGLVIRDLPLMASSHRKTQTLSEFLADQNVVAIAEIDTRKLTRILREKGAQSGCIMAGEINEDKALQTARAFPGLAGMDLAKVVSCQQSYTWTEGEWSLESGFSSRENPKYHVAAFDFGIKRTILRKLAQRDCKVTVFPAQTTADEILAIQPDGVFLSNGPGDPEPCDYAIEATRELLKKIFPSLAFAWDINYSD